MILTKKTFLEIVDKGNEERRLGINSIIQSTREEVEILKETFKNQIDFLTTQVTHYRELFEHERARADAAVDNLLASSHLNGIANADLQRKLAEESIKHPEPINTKEADLEKIFAGVGE